MALQRLPKELRRRLMHAVERSAIAAGLKCFDIIQGKYESTITKFYKQYSPEIYNRTWNLYNASTGASDFGGRKVYGLIRDTEANEQSKIADAVLNKVSYDSYAYKLWGIRRNYRKFSCTVRAGIKVGAEFIKTNPYYTFEGDPVDTKTVYNITYVRGYHGRVLHPRMYPSPAGVMGGWFDKFNTLNNILDICTPVSVDAFKKFYK